MQVGTQTLGPTTFTKHLIARAHSKKSRRKVLLIALTLTSMVDMFSLLVIFLLQTFSASPEMLVVTKGVTLPEASTGAEIKDAPVLALSTAGVYLDQKFVGLTEDLLTNPEPLMKALSDLRDLWQKSHPSETFKGEVNLQAHREIPSSMVARFMAMLPSQAYGSVQLIVTSGGE